MDRTNITNDGYTYNGQNYKNETRVDGQGNNYNVSLPTTIPAEYLAPPKNNPIQVTQPTYNTDALQTQSQQALGYVNGSLQSAEAQATAEAQRQKDAYNSANTDLAKLQSELGGKSADINDAYNQVDQNGNSVNTLASKLRQLSAQSQALGYQKTIIPSQLQNNAAGTGATDRGLAPIEAGQLRNNMIQQATIAMQAAVINADYQSAKGYADQIVDAKYEQRLADIEAKKTNINNIMFNLTDAQKKQADATLQRLNKEQRDYEDLKANEKSISDMVIQASSQNAPQDLVAKAKEAKSPSEAAMILGQYAGDYYAVEKIKAEIKKMNAEASKTAAEASRARSSSGGSSSSAVSVGVNGKVLSANSPADAWLAQYNAGAMSLEDIYTKIGSSKSAEVVKNELARKIADQGGKRVIPEDDAQIMGINDQITNIDDLLRGDGFGSIVGVVQGGYGIIPDKHNTGKQDVLAIAQNLISNQTLQALADAKSKGITFGALSDAELNTVAATASKLASKAVKDDKGKVTGFTGSEDALKADLLKLKTLLQKSVVMKTGAADPGSTKADQAVKVITGSEDPSYNTGNYNFSN